MIWEFRKGTLTINFINDTRELYGFVRNNPAKDSTCIIHGDCGRIFLTVKVKLSLFWIDSKMHALSGAWWWSSSVRVPTHGLIPKGLWVTLQGQCRQYVSITIDSLAKTWSKSCVVVIFWHTFNGFCANNELYSCRHFATSSLLRGYYSYSQTGCPSIALKWLKLLFDWKMIKTTSYAAEALEDGHAGKGTEAPHCLR